MNSRRWTLIVAAAFIIGATALYVARWLIFGQAHEMLRFLVGDIAFLFIQIPLVTLFIDRLLAQREKQQMLRKLNMVIGAFYSQVGTRLMGRIAACDDEFSSIRPQTLVTAEWTADDFARAATALRAYGFKIEAQACDLEALRADLMDERPFLLGLLGNQNLLEHETFTELLWAVFHLAEELAARDDLTSLPRPDATHLAGDIQRAYVLLIVEWLSYMRHLQVDYPYLFSLAVRTNPLDPEADVTVTT